MCIFSVLEEMIILWIVDNLVRKLMIIVLNELLLFFILKIKLMFIFVKGLILLIINFLDW